jgi:hypothetical protein
MGGNDDDGGGDDDGGDDGGGKNGGDYDGMIVVIKMEICLMACQIRLLVICQRKI